MKRLLSAALLAVMFHAWLSMLEFDWLIKKTFHPNPDTTEVTITMSYRQPEPAPREIQPARQLIEKPKIVKPEKKPIKEMPKRVKKAYPRPVAPNPAEKTGPDDIGEKREDTVSEDTSDVSSAKSAQIAENRSGAAGGAGTEQVTKLAIPSYRINPTPPYPRAARTRGMQGVVVLSVFVNENGKVSNLWVSASSGYVLLDNAAVKAVKGWAFEPGMKGNKKIAMWVKVPIRFELKP